MNTDWKKIVATVAPTLAMALGGPLAGTAVTELSKVLFGADNVPEAKISEAVMSADPETLLKIKEADQRFATEMAKLDLNLEQVAAADRADARTMQVASNDKTPMILAIVVTTGFFGLLGSLFVWVPPAEAETVLQIMLGALGASYLGVINFYFGSSAGSKQKSELFAQMSATKR